VARSAQHELPVERIPNRNQLLWKLHGVNIGERDLRRQTSDKEIGRFFGFLKFFCVYRGSFEVFFYKLMHLFSVPDNSQAIRHEVTV
jgi:hypothetical protein